MPYYKLEYYDNRYPGDLQGKLDAQSQDGWEIETATISYPYLHVLWKREGKGTDTENLGRDIPQDGTTDTPNSPAAHARQREHEKGDIVEDKTHGGSR